MTSSVYQHLLCIVGSTPQFKKMAVSSHQTWSVLKRASAISGVKSFGNSPMPHRFLVFLSSWLLSSDYLPIHGHFSLKTHLSFLLHCKRLSFHFTVFCNLGFFIPREKFWLQSIKIICFSFPYTNIYLKLLLGNEICHSVHLSTLPWLQQTWSRSSGSAPPCSAGCSNDEAICHVLKIHVV